MDVAHGFTDAAIATRLICALSARKNPVVIDYKHQTLRNSENGPPATTAGLTNGSKRGWESGGLFADSVEWTRHARELIKNVTIATFPPFSPATTAPALFSNDPRGSH